MMTPSKFLSNACPQTREAIEDDYAARMEAAIAEACAHLSDQNIDAEIAGIIARRVETSYCLKYSTASVQHDTDLLAQLRGERARRQRVKFDAIGVDIDQLQGEINAAQGYVPKPIDEQPLVKAVAQALGLSGSLGSYGKRVA